MNAIHLAAIAALSLASLSARASTLTAPISGQASVDDLQGQAPEVVPWTGLLTVETPSAADGTYLALQASLESNLADVTFDTNGPSQPLYSIFVTVSDGQVTSLTGGLVDQVIEDYTRRVTFSGDSLELQYFSHFADIDATGTLAVPEPASSALFLAALVATVAFARRVPRPKGT
jgi:hypothetical protein